MLSSRFLISKFFPSFVEEIMKRTNTIQSSSCFQFSIFCSQIRFMNNNKIYIYIYESGDYVQFYRLYNQMNENSHNERRKNIKSSRAKLRKKSKTSFKMLEIKNK